MKILQLHSNYSGSSVSGENVYVQRLKDLLSDTVQIDNFVVSTEALINKQFFSKALSQAAFNFINTRNELAINLADNYDLVLVHNQVPFFSSETIEAISMKRPVLRVWHNVKNICIQGGYFRNGLDCFQCRDSSFGRLPGVIHKCYRQSTLQSIVLSENERQNSKTFKNKNYFHVAISEYVLKQMLLNGISREDILLIPNFSEERKLRFEDASDYLFVGRLEEAKGWQQLIRGWGLLPRELREKHFLHIVGEGKGRRKPELSEFTASELLGVIFHGYLTPGEVMELTCRCRTQIVPSQWEEPFGTVAIEGLSQGLRLIVTPSGGLTSFGQAPGVIISRDKSALGLFESLSLDFENSSNNSKVIQEYWRKNFGPETVRNIWLSSLTNLIFNN